jgi:hypothetical protein
MTSPPGSGCRCADSNLSSSTISRGSGMCAENGGAAGQVESRGGT